VAISTSTQVVVDASKGRSVEGAEKALTQVAMHANKDSWTVEAEKSLADSMNKMAFVSWYASTLTLYLDHSKRT
jgi:hypothetical protein